jgi:hypothetical protein
MARAQLEVSFQWIFAIIAGSALLLFFVFAFRGCVQSGEERVSSTGLRAAVTQLRTDAWQPVNTTRVMPSVDVQCVPGGALTLTTRGDAPMRSTLDNVPAFLSPTLSGSTRVVVKELFLPAAQPGDPRISLGSVLYAMSPDVQYYIIKDPALQPALDILNIKQSTVNVKLVDNLDAVRSLTVPSSARAVVIVGAAVSKGNPKPASVPSDIEVYWVKVALDKTTTFSTEAANGLPMPLSVPELQAGAIVAGDIRTFTCSKSAVDQRTHFLAKLWLERIGALSSSSLMGVICKQKLEAARFPMPVMAGATNTLYVAPYIKNSQHDLYVSGCPVIA